MKYLFFIVLIALSMNVFAQQDPYSRTSELANFRKELEIKMEKTPYYGEEHAAIKKYFVELQSLNEDLANNRRYLRKYNNYIRNEGVENFCTEALLDKPKWSQLIINCTKNNFFLCSEDVKLYPTIKETLLKLLDEDVQKEIAETDACLF